MNNSNLQLSKEKLKIQQLSNYEYGCYYKKFGLIKGYENNINLPNKISKLLTIQTQQQLETNKCGMCHDVSTYLYNYLNNSNKYLVFIDEYIPKTQIYSTHSFIIYNLFNSKYYTCIDPFTYKSIGYDEKYEFNNILDTIKYRINKWIKEENHIMIYIRCFIFDKNELIETGILMNNWRDFLIKNSKQINL